MKLLESVDHTETYTTEIRLNCLKPTNIGFYDDHSTTSIFDTKKLMSSSSCHKIRYVTSMSI